MNETFEKQWIPFVEKLVSEEAHAGDLPQNLKDSMLYSLQSPGKRIRPHFLLASARLFDFNFQTIFPAAASIEMIHCFTLIHDDLPCLDNDDYRRGKPSNHKVYGEAIALLAGDGVFALAFEALLKSDVSARGLVKASQRLARVSGRAGVVAGQVLELNLLEKEATASLDITYLRQMHSLKTSVLFEAAILLPMDLSDRDITSEKREFLSDFARNVGLAFQTLDDIEDYTQDVKRSKKTTNNILFYKDEKTVRAEWIEALSNSCNKLHLHFGPSSNELISLCNEMLIQRLKE